MEQYPTDVTILIEKESDSEVTKGHKAFQFTQIPKSTHVLAGVEFVPEGGLGGDRSQSLPAIASQKDQTSGNWCQSNWNRRIP